MKYLYKATKLNLLFVLAILFTTSVFSQAPACTKTYASGNSVDIINNNEVGCITLGSSFNGSLLVRAGGTVIVCNGTFTGSLTLDPAWGPIVAAKLWDGPGQAYTGAVSNNGTHDNTGIGCGIVCPTVTLSSFSNVCITTSTFALSGGLPTGGTYSGPGVSAGNFNPSSAGVGTHTITYTDGVGGCGNTAQKTITVVAASVGGTVSSSATVCSGSNSGTLNLTGQTGSVVRWESSTNNWGATATISNTGTSQSYSNITTTTKYRAVLKSGVCSEATSSEVTITVDPASDGGTLSSSATICAGTNSGTLTLASNVGSVTRWESSTNNWVSTTSIANTTTSLAYTNVAATTKYRVVVTSGSCASNNSNEITLTVDPASDGGTLSSSATVCVGTNSGTLTLASIVGTVTRWESSINNWVSTTSIANTTTSLAYTNVATTTKYRVVVTSGSCASDNSNEITITVDPASDGGTLSANATVCAGTNSGTLTLASNVGSVTRWESSDDNWSTTNSIANTTTSQGYTNLTATTKYRVVVTSGSCASDNSNEITITVDPASDGGTLSSSATVCATANSGTLTLASIVGTVTRWESSDDNWSTTTSIANTTNSQAYTNLSTTTKYRVVVTSGACASANSNEITITVDPASDGGTLSSSATVCEGINGGTLTLAGTVGSVTRWESSTNNWSTTTSIANTTTSLVYLNLTTTVKYRAIITSGSCASDVSNEIEITVDPSSSGGTLTSDATVCATSNSGTLNLIGFVGSVTRWESSTNNWVATTNIVNTTTSQAYNNLSTTTKYRVVVSSGGGACSSANSNEVTITVDPASDGGVLSTNATVCSGSNTGTLTLAGSVGSVTRWESSDDNWTTTNSIANTTTSLAYTNLTATTKYRVVVTSGACVADVSNEITITVDPVSDGGTLSSDATVCEGSNSGTLTVAGISGSITRWESSDDNWTTTNSIANTTASQVYTNLTSTTKYRVVVSSGVCASDNSNEVTITVDPATVGGTLSSNATVCATSNSGTLLLTGSVGTITRWESSTDNWTTTTNITNATASQVYNNLSTTTKYRVVVVSGVCSSTTSNEITITVEPTSDGGTLSSDATVCASANSGTLTLAGNIGSVTRWESSDDNWTTTNSIVNTTTSLAYTNLSATTKYRVVVTSGACSSDNSNEVTITVDPATVGGTLSSDATVCATSNSGTLTLAGSVGTITRWESSDDNWTTTTNISNTTVSQGYTNLSTTTKYRVVVISGSCSSTTSNEVTITVDPTTDGGILSTDASVCSGSNSGTLTLAGNVGTVTRWESSDDNWTTTTSIANTTTSQAYTNLTATTKYRVVVTSGACSSDNSNDVTITVDPVSVGGVLTADVTVCAGSNAGTLNVTGITGTITRWESSDDNWVTTNSITNTTASQAYINLTATTKYRVVVTSGTCASDNSNEITITVDPASSGGNLSSDANVCLTSNTGILTLVANIGTISNWESSTDNWATTNVVANTTTSLIYNNITATTKYRVVSTSNVCASSRSNDVTITVDPVSDGGTLSSDINVCFGSNTGTLTLASSVGSVTGWESSTDNWVTTTSIVNTTTSQAYTNLTTTTKYRVVVTSGACASDNSNEVTVTVDPTSVGGTLSADINECSGSNSGTLSLTGNIGTITGWESSTDNWTTSTSITNITASQAYSNLTTTTKYRAIVTSGTCSSDNSNEVTVTIDPVSVGGVLTSDMSVCFGTNTGTLALTGNIGTITNWESSDDNWLTTTNIVNTTASQLFNNLTTTTKFRAVVASGVCSSDNSNEITVSVDPISDGGILSKDTSVCSGSNTGALTLTGNVGTITNWESSDDNWLTTTNIVNTSATQVFNNLTSTTLYRVVVASGTCSSDNSNEITVTVNPISDGGLLSKDTTVCFGTNTGTLTLSGNVGTITNWESSIDNWTTTTNIINTSNTQAFSNLSVTTKFRAVVTSGVCSSDNSNEVTVTVDPVSVGGTLSTDASVCYGANSGTLTLIGNVGTITGWESSTDNWATSKSITNTSASQVYNNLTDTTKYRAIITSGVCSSTTSNEVTITVDPTSVGGTLSSDTTVCLGVNSGTLTLAGNVGNIIGWESSTDNWATSTSIVNTTNTQAYTNLTVTTKYRAIVVSGTCSSNNSNEVTVTIDPTSVGGTLSSDINVCLGSNSGTLTLAGNVGSVTRWESSTDNWLTTTNIVNTTNSQAYNNLTSTAEYRVIVTSGTCSSDTSNEVTVTMDAVSIGGTLSANDTVCSGINNGTLILTGNVGSVTRWESSTDNWVSVTNISNTSASLNYNNITSTTEYRVIITSGTCSADTSSEVTITVDPTSIGGLLNSNNLVCWDSNTGILNLTGNVGNIIRWESSTDNWLTSSPISNITNTQNYQNLQSVTKYRIVVVSGVCAANNSNEITIDIAPIPYVDLGNDTTVCTENQYLLDAGSTGTNYLWNDGSTTNAITTSGTGVYSVIVTDDNNCIGYDTISIDTFASPIPVINIQDTAICSGDSVVLSVSPIYTSYTWKNDTSTSNTAIIKTTNTYVLSVLSTDGCFGSDTSTVIVNELPNPNIGDSLELCIFKPLMLTARTDSAKYNWSTSESTKEIQISSFGDFWVHVIDSNGCEKSDTIYVYEGPMLEVDLGNDTATCPGDSLKLDPGSFYLEIWNSSDTLSEYYVKTNATVDVLAIDINGCYGRDTIINTMSTTPSVLIVQDDSLTLCELAFDEIDLNILDDQGMNIQWNSGETTNDITVITVGEYIVSKTNADYCVGYDTLQIIPYCRPVKLTLPNIFTPNDDGINESHIPIEVPKEDIDYLMSNIVTIDYVVYNRWGNVVYSSVGVLPKWNGINFDNGVPSAQGTYFWVLKYTDVSGGDYKYNGFVQLVR